MAIRPLGTNVVLEPVKVGERMSQGGVHLPSVDHWASIYKGEVMAIGPEVTTVLVGELVLITLGTGNGLEHEGEERILVDIENILAVLDR